MDIYNFYNSKGWKKTNDVFHDAKLFEDLRKSSRVYVSNCRKRVLEFLPANGNNMLDFASGPLQYKEYLTYSKNFQKRHCIDFSRDAIKLAKKKIGKKGKFYCGDFLKLKLKKNFFDCTISLHTIYHIKKNTQKRAVKKLIDVTKPGSPIIIIYSNPNTIINRLKDFINYKNNNKKQLYFYCHSIKWWNQFKKYSNVSIHPWRSFSSQHQKKIFMDNFIGKRMFDILFYLEKIFLNFFVKNFQYYIVILKKN